MGLIEYARKELDHAKLFDKDSDYEGMLGHAALDLIKVFSKQGHSGSSAHIVSDIFNKLSRYKPLGPLTGDDSEWNDVSNESFQNKRYADVFREKKSGRAYYLNAIIFRDEDGSSFTGSALMESGERITSKQNIIKFPFYPKSFYVDVFLLGEEYIIKDENRLNEVFEYYDKCE